MYLRGHNVYMKSYSWSSISEHFTTGDLTTRSNIFRKNMCRCTECMDFFFSLFPKLLKIIYMALTYCTRYSKYSRDEFKLYIQKNQGMVTGASNPSTQEAEAKGLQV
jgi:hypothetical protein